VILNARGIIMNRSLVIYGQVNAGTKEGEMKKQHGSETVIRSTCHCGATMRATYRGGRWIHFRSTNHDGGCSEIQPKVEGKLIEHYEKGEKVGPVLTVGQEA
jgi:hypothetical protein